MAMTIGRMTSAAQLAIASFMLGGGCAGEGDMRSLDGADWLDSEEVQAVAFHPRREARRASGSNHEDLDIPVQEGVTIGARFHAAGKERPTILFFHGNGEIVADYDQIAPLYLAAGANFLPAGYRGYGRSSGRPTIRSMLSDSGAVFGFAREWLASKGFEGPIIVMGRSLGSASALEIASAFPEQVGGLIIESGFSDVIALLQRLGARLPREIEEDNLVRQTGKISAYSGPTLIIHGTRDSIIPLREAEALFDASSSQDKRLVKIAGAGHNNLLALGIEEYMEAVAEIVKRADVK